MIFLDNDKSSRIGYAAGNFWGIVLSNVADTIDESKEYNDFIFNKNTDNDDTNTDVKLLL